MSKTRIEDNKKRYVVGPRFTHEEIMVSLMSGVEEDLKSDKESKKPTENQEPKPKEEPKSS